MGKFYRLIVSFFIIAFTLAAQGCGVPANSVILTVDEISAGEANAATSVTSAGADAMAANVIAAAIGAEVGAASEDAEVSAEVDAEDSAASYTASGTASSSASGAAADAPASTDSPASASASTSTDAPASTGSPAAADDDNNAVTSDPLYILPGLPDDLYSFAALLDGVVYSLPAPYSVFMQNGWAAVITDLSNTIIGSNKTELIEMINGEHTVYMGFFNNTESDIALVDSFVGMLHVRESDASSGTQIALPGGISIGDAYDDIFRTYGTESKRVDYNWVVSLQFKEQNSWLELELDVSSLQVISMNYRNYSRRGKLPEYTGAPPAIIDNYTAPVILGDNWQTLECIYGGDIYRLPVPAAELIKNGWVFVTDENTMLAPGENYYPSELRKDNQILYTNMINPDDKAQPLKYCFITEFSYDRHYTKITLELPGGVSERSSVEEIAAAYGEPDYIDDSGSMFAYYSYGTNEYGINITQSIESLLIVEFVLFVQVAD